MWPLNSAHQGTKELVAFAELMDKLKIKRRICVFHGLYVYNYRIILCINMRASIFKINHKLSITQVKLNSSKLAKIVLVTKNVCAVRALGNNFGRLKINCLKCPSMQ